MTKGMAARAGFFSEFLGSNHKGNGGIRRRRGPLSPPQRATGPCRPLGGRQGPVPRQQSLLNCIKFLQRPKIYCDIFAEGFGNRVRIIKKFTERVGCQFWWAMRPLKDDTRETTFHVISNYKLFLSARMSGRCRFHVDLHKPIMIRN